MKTVYCFLVMLLSLSAAAVPNEKVLESFTSSFPHADSVQWYEGDHDYNVYFLQDGIRCRVWYDELGNVKKSLRYYDGSKLPPLVLGNLSKKYPDLKIFGVTELSSPEQFVYQIAMEDDKKWYMVNADATGNLSMTSKLTKADKN